MKADSHRARLRRIYDGLQRELRVVGDSLAGGYPLDAQTLRELSLTLSRLSNDARVSIEAARFETHPLQFGGTE